jgi:hypothetical protein
VYWGLGSCVSWESFQFCHCKNCNCARLRGFAITLIGNLLSPYYLTGTFHLLFWDLQGWYLDFSISVFLHFSRIKCVFLVFPWGTVILFNLLDPNEQIQICMNWPITLHLLCFFICDINVFSPLIHLCFFNTIICLFKPHIKNLTYGVSEGYSF